MPAIILSAHKKQKKSIFALILISNFAQAILDFKNSNTQVPEIEMAAAPEPLVATSSKLPTAEPSVPSAAEEEKEEVTLRGETAAVPSAAETNNHRSSTFLTEVEEDEGAGPATSSLADIVAAVSEVENVGSIKDVDVAASDAKEPSPPPSKEASPAPAVKEASPPAPEKAASPQPEKETSPEPVKETSPAPEKETSPSPAKETSPAPEKETSPAPTQEVAPEPVKEASPAPAKEAIPAKEATTVPSKEESPAKEEPVKEASPAPPAKEGSPAKAEEEPIGAVEDLKAEVNALLSTPAQQDAEDAKVIEEAKKEVIDETEESKEETKEEGAVIDIQVIEEKKEDADVLDIVKAAEEAFVAEVIPDNAEVEITPEEGEEVIEYTLNTADAIPIGAIAVATFAIFLALIFFYN